MTRREKSVLKLSLAVLMSVLILSYSCSGKKKAKESSLKDLALEQAVEFASARFGNNTEKSVEGSTVKIKGNSDNLIVDVTKRLVFSVDASLIRTGDINSDGIEDALAIIETSKGSYFETPELLVLINNGAKLELKSVLEADMKVIEIKNGLIRAEVLTRSRNSPLRDCNSCREVADFRYEDGELKKVR